MNDVVPTVLTEVVIPHPPAAPVLAAAVHRPAVHTAADEARLRSMVDAHFDFVWRALRGLGIPSASADDAAQSVFLIASQKLANIAPGSERAFLFATARGVAANLRRAQRSYHQVLDAATHSAEGDRAPSPEEQLAAQQGLRALERFLAGLDEDMRAAFVLFELEGMTTAEIAALLAVPMGTVASRLRRAREEFQAFARRFHGAAGGGP
jgi:RNA polymerase sigma-70 factor (ECF subfamily)